MSVPAYICGQCPPFSHHLNPPHTIFPLILPIYLFVCIPFPFWLLIVVVHLHSFFCQAFSSSPRASSFQQHPRVLAGRPPGCSKNSHILNSTCGPVQPNRGFHGVDDGAHTSFLSPHKSVGELVLSSNINTVFHDILLSSGGKAVVDSHEWGKVELQFTLLHKQHLNFY